MFFSIGKQKKAKKSSFILAKVNISLKNMALLYCSFWVSGTMLYGGTDYFETVSPYQSQLTKDMINTKKGDIETEIDKLAETIETNSKCGLERLRTLTGILVLTERSLINRKKYLEALRGKKQMMLKKDVKKQIDKHKN